MTTLSYQEVVSQKKCYRAVPKFTKLLDDLVSHNGNKKYNAKTYKPGDRKSSVLKNLLSNNDQMINNFNKSINSLTVDNYDTVYDTVVKYFAEYIAEIITDYIRSYSKFGIDGKCHIEDLNLSLINEKYQHYQVELWKLLINKYINGAANSKVYLNFITSLSKWKTTILNEKLETEIKNIFKTMTGFSYDNIDITDIDDEDPLQFFLSKNKITEVDEKTELIYNKISDVIVIFSKYNFELTKINELNTDLSNIIYGYVCDEQANTLYNNDDIINKIFLNHIKNIKTVEKYLALFTMFNSSSLGNITYILNKINDELKEDNELSNEIKTKYGYILLGIIGCDAKSLLMNKEVSLLIKDLTLYLNKLPSMLRYKLLDICEKY